MTGPGCGWSKISRVRAPYDNLGPAVKPLQSPESAVYIMDSLLDTRADAKRATESTSRMLLQSGPLLAAPKPTILRDLSLPRNPEERIRARPFGGPARPHVGTFRSFIRPRRETRRFLFFLFSCKRRRGSSPCLKAGVPAAKKLMGRLR